MHKNNVMKKIILLIVPFLTILVSCNKGNSSTSNAGSLWNTYNYTEEYSDFTYSVTFIHESETESIYDVEITNTGDSFINKIWINKESYYGLFNTYFDHTLIEPGATKKCSIVWSKPEINNLATATFSATRLITKDESTSVTGSLAISTKVQDNTEKYFIDFAFNPSNNYNYAVIELEYLGNTYFVYNDPESSFNRLKIQDGVSISDVTVKSVIPFKYEFIPGTYNNKTNNYFNTMAMSFLLTSFFVSLIVVPAIAIPVSLTKRHNRIKKAMRENDQHSNK